jgi:hypothetical protein
MNGPHLSTGKQDGYAGAPEAKPIETEWRTVPKDLGAETKGDVTGIVLQLLLRLRILGIQPTFHRKPQGVVVVYLARQTEGGKTHYYIRESYLDGTRWKSRDLVALGQDPTRWVHYPTEKAYYIDETIEDALSVRGLEPSQEELEEIFWPFLDPAVRSVIRRHSPRFSGKNSRRVPFGDLAELQKGIHVFDKRRMHFLRYGATDPRKKSSRPLRAYNRLLQKSRDEIEHMFQGMETALRPHERRMYVYFAFNLQRVFASPLAGRYPQAMDPDTMDEAFLDEVCRLQSDGSLFPEGEGRYGLDPALVRYVIMHFDNEFRAPRAEWDYVQDFMGRHRRHRKAVGRRPRLPIEEACRVLDISQEGFPRLTLRQLAQHYRRKALECHPDQGGSHEQFIRLTKAYKDLLARKFPPSQ